jgi:hypothetical protein
MTASRNQPFASKAVAAVFDPYPKAMRGKLMALRRLIFDTAERTDGVGRLEETLKWGQPSYLTPETNSGTTVRIDRVKYDPELYALYVPCQTNLVDTFRELYPREFRFEGDRAILLRLDSAIPEERLRHCIALALTYHRRKPGRDRRRDIAPPAGTGPRREGRARHRT